MSKKIKIVFRSRQSKDIIKFLRRVGEESEVSTANVDYELTTLCDDEQVETKIRVAVGEALDDQNDDPPITEKDEAKLGLKEKLKAFVKVTYQLTVESVVKAFIKGD